MRVAVYLVFFIPLMCLAAVTKESEKQITELIYPPVQSELDKRDQDLIEILRTAMEKTEKTDGPFTMRTTKIAMNALRFLHELEDGNEPNIIWASTTKDRQKRFLPIRIPLRKGILGYRVFLIRKSDQPKFSAMTSVEMLKSMKAGQGATWLDTEILRANNFIVETGFNYEGLFKMLHEKRFDYFPRGINEVYVELQQRQNQHPDIDVEQTILLHYPFPKYFFVNRKNKQLADRIERGLNIMINDGSFDQIFFKYNKFYIDAIQLHHRKVYKITNPFLPDDVPFGRKELWFNLY